MPTYPPTTESFPSEANPVTSSLVDPIPVPTYGPGGSFSILTKTTIPTAPMEVLSLVRDTSTWSTWNSFCPSCTITPSKTSTPAPSDSSIPSGNKDWLDLGTNATIDVHMSGDGLVPGGKRSRTQGLCITYLEPIDRDGKKGYMIAWKGVGFSNWQLHSERVMEFTEHEMEDGSVGTSYVCWETFAGMLAPVVKATVGSQLIDRFGDYSRDLRGYFVRRNEGAGDGERVEDSVEL